PSAWWRRHCASTVRACRACGWPRAASAPRATPASHAPLLASDPSALVARRQRIVLLGQAVDQGIDAAGTQLARELVAEAVGGPQSEHVEVVDLPAGVGLLEAIVELDRLALAHHVGADRDLVGIGAGAHRAQLDALIAHLRQRTGIGVDQEGLELL